LRTTPGGVEGSKPGGNPKVPVRSIKERRFTSAKRWAKTRKAVEADLRKEEVELDDQTKYGVKGAMREPSDQVTPAREEG
jgi:hypothetical protein